MHEERPHGETARVNGHVIWEIVEEEQPKVPSISLGEVPAIVAKKESGGGKAGKRKDAPTGDEAEEKESEEKETHFLPHGAVTVADGRLFIASHIDFLLEVLKPIAKGEGLADNPEYKHVRGDGRQAGAGEALRPPIRPHRRGVSPTYELIRQGKMPESESLLARALNTVSGAAKKRRAAVAADRRPAICPTIRSCGVRWDWAAWAR